MKDRIENLQSLVFEKIQSAAVSQDVEEISRLTPLSKKLQALATKLEGLSAQISDIEEEFENPNRAKPPQMTKVVVPAAKVSKGRRTHLRIEIDWEANGHSYPRQVIEEPTAAASMITLLRTLHCRLGIKVLEKAEGFIINRGPFVSSKPFEDYRNPSTGEIYGNSHISGTRFNVLTHSETKQKVSDLRKFLKGVVGFRSDSFSVKKV